MQTLKRVCFATYDGIGDEWNDDGALTEAVAASHGFAVEYVSWTKCAADWASYDLVVIRSTWDYYEPSKCGRFAEWLKSLRDGGVAVANSVDVMLWNMNKVYLRELAESGIGDLPACIWLEKMSEVKVDLKRTLGERGWSEVVVKPTVSAGSDRTNRITLETASEYDEWLRTELQVSDMMVQQYVPSIVEGEISLHFFGGVYSHSVIKRPKAGDFRVQNIHGGKIEAYSPEAKGLSLAQRIVDGTPAKDCLYVRVDLVVRPWTSAASSSSSPPTWDERGYYLMELELIEPMLYLHYDSNAPTAFAKAIQKRLSIARG
eukprot:Opistho-2@41095